MQKLLPFDLHSLCCGLKCTPLLLSQALSFCLVTCEEAYLVGVAGLKDVTRHLGLRVVRLASQEIGKICEVIAVVDEPRDELHFVLEYED